METMLQTYTQCTTMMNIRVTTSKAAMIQCEQVSEFHGNGSFVWKGMGRPLMATTHDAVCSSGVSCSGWAMCSRHSRVTLYMWQQEATCQADRGAYLFIYLFMMINVFWEWSRVSSVSTATGYGLDSWGVEVRVPIGAKIFFSASFRQVLGLTQPPIKWEPGALSPGVKQQGREAHHSPRTNDKAKKTWVLYIHSPASSWCSA
jgi:hypothetical protein